MSARLFVAALALAIITVLPTISVAENQTHTIRDEFGFEKPLDAFTVTLPKDWAVQGAVQWYGRPTCYTEPMKMHFMATAPDGKQWVEYIPGGVWGWGSSLDAMPYRASEGLAGCDARPIVNIQSFVDQYIPTIRPNARITTIRPRSDQAQELLAAMGNMNLQPNQRPRMEVVEVRLSYEANGHTVNELLLPAVLFIDQPAMDMYGGMSGYTTIAMAVGTITTATVSGEADEALLKMVGEGMSPNPQYLQRLGQLYQQRSRLMAEAGKRRRAAQQAWLASRRAAAKSRSNWQVDKSGSDILDIQMDTYNNTSAMRDSGQARAADAMLEQKPWLNSDGESIYMPQEYQRVYQLPNGVYHGTNDPFFNSLETYGEFATPMQEQSY
ncbi:MAG: hypothetical protein AAGJ86_10095 [Pseudomonadota bacterium]